MGFFEKMGAMLGGGETPSQKQEREAQAKAEALTQRDTDRAEAEARLAGRESNFGGLGSEENKAVIQERVAKVGLAQAEAKQQKTDKKEADRVRAGLKKTGTDGQ